MTLSRQLFSSRVARRIFAAFVFASLLPLLLFAWLASHQVSGELEKNGLRDVRDLAKRTGLATFDQLAVIRGQIQLAAQLTEPDQAIRLLSENTDLARRVKRLFWLSPGIDQPGVSKQLRQQLRRQLLVLVPLPGDRPESQLFLATPGPGGTHLVAEVNTDLLWASAGVANRNEVICVIDSLGQPAYCNQPISPGWPKHLYQVALRGESEQLLADAREGAILSAVWGLFLKPHYGIQYWYFAVGAKEADRLAPLQLFRTLFPLLVVLVLSISLLLGIHFVRGNLRPLERLLAAARRLGQGDFTARAQVRSNDEFEQLALAFDQAAENLGRNFEHLQAIADLEQGLRKSEDEEEILQHGLKAIDRIGGGQVRALFTDRHHEQLLALQPQAGGEDIQRRIMPGAKLPQRPTSGPLYLLANAHPYLGHLDLPPDAQVEMVPIVPQDLGNQALLVLGDPRLDENGRAVMRQIAELLDLALHNRALNRKLYFQAKHDPLTRLLNRVGMTEQFAELREVARQEHLGILVILFDLDRFKDINDSLGHATGDQLLVEIASRLSTSIAPLKEVVASRFSGDEFVLLSKCPHGAVLDSEVQRLRDAVDQVFASPFNLAQREFNISASKGLTVCQGDAYDFRILLQQADLAMYHAKRTDKGGFSRYDDGLSQQLRQRLDLENALRQALSLGQLRLFYQPIVDRRSGRIRGAEALIRWDRDGQLVSPALFIPVVEEMGLIDEFGLWVFEQACSDLARWQIPPDSLYVSVNISAAQVEDLTLASRFADILKATGTDPRSLALEITETAVMKDDINGTAILTGLRDLGLQLLVDDFGTGHASLKYLRNLPIDGIKVDQMFVAGLPDNNKDAAIVASLAVLAKDLDIRVVVEGVENQAQQDHLMQLGLSVMQGYLFSRPLPTEQFEADWLTLPGRKAGPLT